jgi:putative FmdB family regulatory protein
MRWDFTCYQCGATHEQSFPTFDASLDARCPDCKSHKVVRQPCAGTFNVKGFNAKNGYSGFTGQN